MRNSGDPIDQINTDLALQCTSTLQIVLNERRWVKEVILDREAEDLQKAEEERLRTELQKERERTRRTGGQSMTNSSIQSVKIIQRRAARRDLDFDNPFDQDNSFEQTEMETQNKQKSMYERQLRRSC